MTDVLAHFMANEAYYRKATRKFFRKLGDVDDIMQTTALSLLKAKGTVTNYNAVIWVTLKNVAINQARAGGRAMKNTEELKPSMWVTAITPEQEYYQKEIKERIVEALKGDLKINSILKLELVDELTREEICEKLGLTMKQVQSNIKVNRFYGRLNHLKEFL